MMNTMVGRQIGLLSMWHTLIDLTKRVDCELIHNVS